MPTIPLYFQYHLRASNKKVVVGAQISNFTTRCNIAFLVPDFVVVFYNHKFDAT